MSADLTLIFTAEDVSSSALACALLARQQHDSSTLRNTAQEHCGPGPHADSVQGSTARRCSTHRLACTQAGSVPLCTDAGLQAVPESTYLF